jgi:hypothetical protein
MKRVSGSLVSGVVVFGIESTSPTSGTPEAGSKVVDTILFAVESHFLLFLVSREIPAVAHKKSPLCEYGFGSFQKWV